VVHFLKAIYLGISLELRAINVEHNVPSCAICPCEAIILQSINNTFVLLTRQFIAEVFTLNRYHPVQVVINAYAFGIAEEHSRRAM
jgi:hypothetical protein